ncbi:hypothetical protein CANMA_001702 [Candida margitis]|uniref:uncharacterized protein n=1 Tax=Candida margitis TaxID=1775924 RepID=UPI00222774CB|nr:uncharacterized protein CANMA_001702 [Candida margitis]KAI5969255.1 hypothetical protein CANMA_001702 [Candida margitis]
MVSPKISALLLFTLSALLSKANAEDTTSYDGTTVVTVTPQATSTTTVPQVVEQNGVVYIWTNEQGVLTTTTVFTQTTTLAEAEATPTDDTTSTGDSTTPTSDPSNSSPVAVSTSPTTTSSISTSSGAPPTSSTPQETGESSSTATDNNSSVQKTSSSAPDSSSAPGASSTTVAPGSVIVIPTDVPEGDYSTSTVTSETVLDNGSTAVLELVVLYTAVCSA